MRFNSPVSTNIIIPLLLLFEFSPDAVFRIFQFQHEAVSYNFPTTQLELDPSESSSDTNQDSGRAGHVELRTRLLASGIVPNPDVMSDKWVRNHYGLILWKLARYYLYFPFDFASWWSLDRVYAQLVHR